MIKARNVSSQPIFSFILGYGHSLWVSWAQFHQHSTYSFYARGTQKRKKVSQVISLFTLLGSTSVKAERKYVGEIESRACVAAVQLFSTFLNSRNTIWFQKLWQHN